MRATDSDDCWLKNRFTGYQDKPDRRGNFKNRTPAPTLPPPPPPAPPGEERPCDIYAAAGTPCVAAHSMVRALYGGYSGPLYLAKRANDGATREVRVLATGGIADGAAQDAFCRGTSCVVERIFDQSPMGNHLDTAPGGSVPSGHDPDTPVNATRERLYVGGHPVYSACFEPHDGYRKIKGNGVATGDEPETIYMVVSGTHYNYGCCFDYGNAETNSRDDGQGSMETVYFGSAKRQPYDHGGDGPGPCIMADLEKGLWGENTGNSHEPSIVGVDYVTAMVKGDSGNHFAIKGGDATKGALKTYFDGPRPTGYTPMKKQGSIVLGIGGDNSPHAVGTFYEGVMTKGYTSDAADDKVQANIVAASYGR